MKKKTEWRGFFFFKLFWLGTIYYCTQFWKITVEKLNGDWGIVTVAIVTFSLRK